LLIDKTEEIDEMLLDTPRIALRPALPGRFPQGSIYVALGSATVIDFLLGPLGGTRLPVDRFLPGRALGRQRSPLIDIQDGALGGPLLAQGF
jgi:hypothetical protein